MKTIIFSLICLFIIGCSCSPKADKITVIGLTSNTDSSFKKSSSSIFRSGFLISTRREEANKGLCLSYTKEQPMPIISSSIIASTLRVFSNQDIGSIKAGQNLTVMKSSIDDKLDHNDKITFTIPSSDLEVGKRYIFSAIARTVDSLQFEHHFMVNVQP